MTEKNADQTRQAKRASDPVGGNETTPPGAAFESVPFESFNPADVRPWRFHNRAGSGMDDLSLDALAESILRSGQQQLGLARRLPRGDTHRAEAIFGVRRLEACRRAGVPWRAEVREDSFSDAQCAVLMHGENEWTEGVSPLENAVQWKAMLDAGVFKNQSALAADLGCHRGTVSRAMRNVTALLGEAWIAALVRPVMHELTGRSADRLATALLDPAGRRRAQHRARNLQPGTLPAQSIHEALLGGERAARPQRDTVFLRRSGGAGVAAKIERDRAGGFSVEVRPHEQTPAQMAELAEQVETLLSKETAPAAGVRLGRRLAASLTSQEAMESDRNWLEGCIWASARASGLEWDRVRCMAVAESLRTQPGGWEFAVVRAVGGRDADPAGDDAALRTPGDAPVDGPTGA